jgi:hypothetical protein
MVNLVELKALGIVQDSTQTSNGRVLGNFKELFKGWTVVPVKDNVAKTRATLIFISPDGTQKVNIVISPALTAKWRSNEVTVETFAGMQVKLIDKDAAGNAIPARLSLGMNGLAISVDSIEVKDFKLNTVKQYEQLA